MTAETTFFRDLAYVFGAAVVGGTGHGCCGNR